MKDSALGIIETFGFVPAVEAADTALKTASVEITGCRYVGAGLVSIIMTGDISSVKASVDAGKRAAERLGKVISTTVIGRTAQGLETILFDGKNDPKQPEPGQPEPGQPGAGQPRAGQPGANTSESRLLIEEASESTALIGTAEETGDKKEPTLPVKADLSMEPDPLVKPSLEKMSVKGLRNLARTLEPFKIARKKIKFARKDELMEAISDHYRQKED